MESDGSISKPILSFGISSILAGNKYHRKLLTNSSQEKKRLYSAFRSTNTILSAKYDDVTANIQPEHVLRKDAAQECQINSEQKSKGHEDGCSECADITHADTVAVAVAENNSDNFKTKCHNGYDLSKCHLSSLPATTSFPIIPDLTTQSYLLKSFERLQPKNFGKYLLLLLIC